jgi:hypothetical protein
MFCKCRCRVNNRGDTVSEPPSAEIRVSHMPSSKAKKLGKLPQEKVLLELWVVFYTILRTFFKRKGLTNKTTNWLNMVVNPTPT